MPWLWPIAFIQLFQVCELLKMIFSDLIIHHDTNSQIASDDLAQNKQAHDNMYCSLQGQYQSTVVGHKKQNKWQLQENRQQPESS